MPERVIMSDKKKKPKDEEMEVITSGEIIELQNRAKALSKKQWRIVLSQAPIEALFYALMRHIMYMRDVISEHERAEHRVKRVYDADDTFTEWL